MVRSKAPTSASRFPPNRIRELREARELSQGELAQAIGLSYAQLGRIENGKSSLKHEYLRPLAEKLGVEPWDLLTDGPDKRQLAAFEMATRLTDEQFDLWIDHGKVYLKPGRAPGFGEAAAPFKPQTPKK